MCIVEINTIPKLDAYVISYNFCSNFQLRDFNIMKNRLYQGVRLVYSCEIHSELIMVFDT